MLCSRYTLRTVRATLDPNTMQRAIKSADMPYFLRTDPPFATNMGGGSFLVLRNVPTVAITPGGRSRTHGWASVGFWFGDGGGLISGRKPDR